MKRIRVSVYVSVCMYVCLFSCFVKDYKPFLPRVLQASIKKRPQNKPSPKRQIVDSFKLEECTDNNSKLDENGIKFSEQIENTLGKGEIACYKQFLLFP